MHTLVRQEIRPAQVAIHLNKVHGISLHDETTYPLVLTDIAHGGDLYTHLRIISKPYRKRYGSHDRRGRIRDRRSIENRPDIVDQKDRLGYWEGYTVISKGQKGALHGRISERLNVDIYFAHPYSSWECDANENTNGLIRQYLPKKIGLTTVTERDIQFVMDRLNNRARERLGCTTPNKILQGQSVDLLNGTS